MVPDFQKYYVAAKLTQLCELHFSHNRLDWVSIEAHACSPLLIDFVLWLPSKHRKVIFPPTLSHSISLWELTCERWPLCSPHTSKVPIFNNNFCEVCHLPNLAGG